MDTKQLLMCILVLALLEVINAHKPNQKTGLRCDKCKGTKCPLLRADRVCDGFSDCDDGADEFNCPTKPCSTEAPTTTFRTTQTTTR
ncbi:LDL receptor repeat-containing protein egg-2-like [Dreissena polymorpha]|uniref:Uncharacterized protein n=1 Tax=Dreissena polymorpha TaxID=45954 RepID=A0A9D4JNZ3_DREPO|nr:LDL receptor repeat-containing protein egg-2-like [Dreissena polymorpha]KAH3819155.1 hypothetical protein DPMN_120888 [Dreissena polymorpha]